jgi:beta-glucosidase
MRTRRQPTWFGALGGGAALAAMVLTGVQPPGASGSVPSRDAKAWPWLDRTEPLEQRVSQLLAQLTLDEKGRLLYGVAPPASSGAVGYVPGIKRLGVPPLILSDGPVGLRDSVRATTVRPATAMPATVALAASFDRSLAAGYGRLLGQEARARGVDVLYAPAINIDRVPVGGRDFEYFSEDPYLTGQLAAPVVAGVQSQRVAAQVKHFALNNQENSRDTASSNAGQRVMHEIYLPGWQAAIQQGHAWSVMCANNPVNGAYSCENDPLLRDTLEGAWHFDGVVGSDYQATHSAVASVNAGLDQSFTLLDWGAYYRNLPQLVRDGTVAAATVNQRVRRVLRMMFRIGLFDGNRGPVTVDVAAHGAVARRAAAEGTVLLRNRRDLLPLQPAAVHSIAVIGPYAATAYTGGGGSSHVIPYYSVSPVQGIKARAGSAVQVTSDPGTDTAQAAAKARAADVAVVVVGDTSREGMDRPSMSLPGNQDALISAVTAANPNTVVVLETGAPVTMPWLSQVQTLIEAWYPGEEGGTALARVLFGDVDPSGRLPVTFPASAAQAPTMGAPRYPAGPNGYDYTEGRDVGYRGYDRLGLTPLFEFGYGLSYTSFAYTGLRITRTPTAVQVSFTVTNTGVRAGVAVPQLYLSFPAAVAEAPEQLKGFQRIALGAGKSTSVRMALPRSAFQYWAPAGWTVPSGTFRVSVGKSSRRLLPAASLRPPTG